MLAGVGWHWRYSFDNYPFAYMVSNPRWRLFYSMAAYAPCASSFRVALGPALPLATPRRTDWPPGLTGADGRPAVSSGSYRRSAYRRDSRFHWTPQRSFPLKVGGKGLNERRPTLEIESGK